MSADICTDVRAVVVARGIDSQKKVAQDSKVRDQLLRFRPNFVPNRIQLLANDDAERSKVRVLDGQVIEIELKEVREDPGKDVDRVLLYWTASALTRCRSCTE